MASKRQIEANRNNAKRSTGPKTRAGKLRSSRNALRHGLSGKSGEGLEAEKVAEVLLAGVQAGKDELTAMATARARKSRIRDVRYELLAALVDTLDPTTLKRVLRLERYERSAQTVQKRILRSLDER